MSDKFTAKSTLRIITILALTFISIALLIAHATPSAGYELDIYQSTPLLVWVFLYLALLGGAGIIIHQVITRGYESSSMWLMGLLILILSRFTLLYIPYIRGYVSWAGDNISHMGQIKDMLFEGHFYTENFYPVTHSLLAQTILITNLPIQYIANMSTAFLSVFFIIATYLLATATLPKRGQQLLATAIAGTVMIVGGYNVLLMPNGWSIMMLPLLFYFFFKRQYSLAYTILFVIMLVLYPFFHPLSALMVAAVFLAVLMVNWFLWRILKKKDIFIGMTRSDFFLVPMMILMTILIIWILSFNKFHVNIHIMWAQISSGGPDVLGGIEDTLSKIHMSGFEVVIIYFKLYGVITFLIILSLVGILLIVLQLMEVKGNNRPLPFIDVSIAFLFFGSLYLLYILGFPGMSSIGAQRMLSYVVLFSPVMGAVALYGLIQTTKFKYLIGIGLMVLLMIPSGLSVITLYSSPFIIRSNIQITQADMTGMAWMINKKSTSIGCVDIMSPPDRYADAILGKIVAVNRRDISYRMTTKIPDHWGYNEYATVGEQYSVNQYAGITKMDKTIYNTVWSKIGRFTDADFMKLKEDHTVNSLYSNGEMDVYYVLGIGNTAR